MALEKVKVRIEYTKDGSTGHIEIEVNDIADFYIAQEFLNLVCIKETQALQADEKLRGE